jgi:hypothetical protein
MRWCDLTCKEASFPKSEAVDGAGSCRTFVALHCAALDRLVAKNSPCACEAQGKAKPRGKKKP